MRDNLHKLLSQIGRGIKVQNDWEKIEVVAPNADASMIAQVAEVLVAHTSGSVGR